MIECLALYQQKGSRMVGIYQFDWKDIVHGHIEIEADSGLEAERLFRDMKLQQRLDASTLDVDKDTLKIKFVDVGFDDLLTQEEWNDGLKQVI